MIDTCGCCFGLLLALSAPAAEPPVAATDPSRRSPARWQRIAQPVETAMGAGPNTGLKEPRGWRH